MQTSSGQPAFDPSPFSVGQCATLACQLEATAPKPGNVYRGADFPDLTYVDLLLSAVAVGPSLEKAAERRVGETILDAIRATRMAVSTNSNLGTVLLLAPLAKVARPTPNRDALDQVLSQLNVDDAQRTFEAIRIARPGGMGREDRADIHQVPEVSLLDAMRIAAERDLVARQYTNGFHEVLECVVPCFVEHLRKEWPLDQVIVYVQMQLMQEFPDSLIARKCGPDTARQASDRAAEVLRSGSPGEKAFQTAAADFDFWLRADGHRRNPGTTADLIAAGLFVALREGYLNLPIRYYQK